MIKIEGKKFDWFGLTQILKEHKGKLRQIRMLSVNELKKKYKGAALGPLWALIKPTFTLFILWFAFEIGLKRNGGVHFINGKYTQFVFMLTGYVPWFYISECIVGGSRSIRSNKQFVTKLSFPVSNIMTFTSLSGLYIHILLCAIMLVIVGLAVGLSVYAFQLLLILPIMFLFFLFLSWSTAPMGAFSMDFDNMVMSIMSGIFWLSGVIYNSYDMGNKALNKVMLFNPINFFANSYRKAVLYDQFIWNNPLELGIFLGEFLLVFILGAYNYNRLRKRIPDVL